MINAPGFIGLAESFFLLIPWGFHSLAKPWGKKTSHKQRKKGGTTDTGGLCRVEGGQTIGREKVVFLTNNINPT